MLDSSRLDVALASITPANQFLPVSDVLAGFVGVVGALSDKLAPLPPPNANGAG
jgi:hypothetical protein